MIVYSNMRNVGRTGAGHVAGNTIDCGLRITDCLPITMFGCSARLNHFVFRQMDRQITVFTNRIRRMVQGFQHSGVGTVRIGFSGSVTITAGIVKYFGVCCSNAYMRIMTGNAGKGIFIRFQGLVSRCFSKGFDKTGTLF